MFKYKLGQRFYDVYNERYYIIIGYKNYNTYECIVYNEINKNYIDKLNVSEDYLDILMLCIDGETSYMTKIRINQTKRLDNINFSSIGAPLWTKSLAVNPNSELVAFSSLKDNIKQDELGFWYSIIPCDYKIIDDGYIYNELIENKIDTPIFEQRISNTTYENLEYLNHMRDIILEDDEYSFSKDIQYYILDDYYFITIYYYKDNTYSLVINENLSSSKGIKFNKEQRNDIINLLKKY